MDSVYTVALYSPCDQRWYTYTIAVCPNYQLQTAVYSEPDPVEPNSTNTVTMYWYNTTPNTMYVGSTVKVAIYPGTTVPSNLSWNEITPSCDNNGVCSYTFTIDNLMTANPTCTTYTVALMSPCNGNVSRTQVSVPLLETSCPEYEITATYANGSVIMSWTTTGQTGNGESVMLGICAGSTWQGSFSEEAYPSLGNTPNNTQGNTYTFQNLPTLAEGQTTYTVALRSNCDADAPALYTATVNTVSVTDCPQYQITDAFYEEQAATGGDPTSTIPYITVKWRNTGNATEQNVVIGVCPGATWSENRAAITTVSATNNIVSTNGECSYSYDVTNLSLTADDNNTYTVMLMSQTCTTSVVSRTVNINGGNGNNAGTQGTFGPEGDITNLQHTLARKSVSGGRSVIANNYFHVTTSGRSQRIGGIAGRARNTDIMNNYVYGTVGTSQNSGNVAAVIETGTQAKGNYAAHGTGNKNIGQQQGGMVSNTAGFEGQGNHVTLDRSINGIENLTLALNRWVREQNENGGRYRTWRNDLDGTVNNGYPYFGQPDMTAINTNLFVEGCDWAVYQGIVYTRDTVFETHTIDYDMMVDSTITTTIRVHGTTRTLLDDSVMTGLDYEGYGFYISADELNMLYLTMGDEGRASIILTDTLTSEFGCDSIVTLTLTFRTSSTDIPEVEETPTTVNVYPNPTTSVVYVESEDMTHVEVYDNEGRRLQDYKAYGSNKVTVDMTPYVTGVYFVRVHSPHGVTIQKVIKER